MAEHAPIKATNVPAGLALTEFLGFESIGPVKSLRRYPRNQVLGPIEALVSGLQAGGGVTFLTKAEADENLDYDSFQMAWIVNDPVADLNGVYQKIGAAGAGGWSKVSELPYSFYRAQNDGTGTANAIKAANDYPLPGDALVVFNVVTPNTSEDVTVQFNEGSPKAILSSGGDKPPVGGLLAGMLLAGYVDGGNFRLISDLSSAAIQAAAEAALAAAIEASDESQSARDLAIAAADLASTVGAGDVPLVPTRVLAEASSFPAARSYISLRGLNNVGDAPEVLFKRVIGQPDHPGKLRSSDRYLPNGTTDPTNGGWFELGLTRAVPLQAFGVRANGSFDDTSHFLEALDYAMRKKRPLYYPGGAGIGRLMVTDTALYQTLGVDYFEQGLVLIGDAPDRSLIINACTTAKPSLKLDGRGDGKQQIFGRVANIGFKQEGSAAGSHAILYQSTWEQEFDRISIEGMKGAAFRVINAGDGDSHASAHVKLKNIYARDNDGPAWDSTGGTGGITNHELNNCYFIDNDKVGQEGQVIIDGVIHFEMNACSVAGFANVPIPLVRTKRTSIHPQTLKFHRGEYGNASGTHFKSDGVVNFHVDGIRHVRRSGETSATCAYDFTGAGAYGGILIENVELAIDTATPAFTFLKLGGSASSVSNIRTNNINASSFAVGNVMYDISGTIANNATSRLDGGDGRILLAEPQTCARTLVVVPGNIAPDLAKGGWQRYDLTTAGAGTYTVNRPVRGQSEGRRMILTIAQVSGQNLVFDPAGYLVTGIPNIEGVHTFEFIYDQVSDRWRQIAGVRRVNQSWSVSNVSTLRAFDAASATPENVRSAVASLINDLKVAGLIAP